MRVIGLAHYRGFFAQHGAYLDKIADECDIVLTERGPNFERNILERAHRNGKETGYIEGTLTSFKGALSLLVALCYIIKKGWQQAGQALHWFRRACSSGNPGAEAAVEADGKDARHEESRRTVLAGALKSLVAWNFAVSPQVHAAFWLGIKSLYFVDFSPVTDGRSVKMLANGLKRAHKHPGKTIGVFVGGAHADAMQVYAQSPAGRKVFAIKNAVYNVVYLNCLDFSS